MIDYNGLIKKINMMTGSKDKAMLINIVYTYLIYLMESNQMKKSEIVKILQQINEIGSFLKHHVSDEKKSINPLLESAYVLNPIYKDILTYANKYPLFDVNIPHVNINKLFAYANNFLNYIDPKLSSLLGYLIENELIIATSIDDFGGKCYNLGGNTSGIILNYNTVNFYQGVALVHEMGHAYYNYLSKGNPNLVKNYIGRECIPRILEQLFLIFLREKHLVNNDYIERYERYFMMHQLKLTNSVYIINKLLINGAIKENFHIENIKALLPQETFDAFSIIKQKNNKYQRFMEYTNNYYSYAFLLSMIVRENYLENKDEAINFLKEIPYYSREYNALEFINLFDKNDYLNATKKNISRVLSKTNYKK